MPKVSIVVPSFNQGDYIADTIESVLKVIGPEDELIIADAGSTDSTEQNVARYLDDPRVVWNSEPDEGYSDGMTKIAARISGDIMGIMSSDDLYLDFDIDRIKKCFDDDTVQLVFADYDIIDDKGNKIGCRTLSKAETANDIFALKVIIPQSSTFFRTDALRRQLPLSLDYDYVADVAIFNRICANGRWLQYPEVWSSVRRHPGSRTGKKNPGEQYLLFLERELPEQANKPMAMAGVHLLSARYYAEAGQKKKAMSSLLKSLSCSPIGTLNHWLFYRTVAQFLPTWALNASRTLIGSR